MLPIRLNLHKITGIQTLRLIAPLIPGSIILASIASSSLDIFHRFMAASDLGYYSKLLILIAAAYLIGLVLDEVLTVLMGGVFGFLVIPLVKTEARRKMIDNIALAVAPWRDPIWQKIATKYLGTELAPSVGAESQWRSWYLIIKAGFPELEEGLRRGDILVNAAHTAAWSLLIARLILPGHRYLSILIVLTAVCFFLTAMNRILLVLVSFGYFAPDLTGANLGAAMIQEIRRERIGSSK